MFNEKSRFKQTLEYLYDFDESENWNGISETSIISSLGSIFSLKTSYTIKYDNLPVAGLEKRDTILGVTLLINL